MLYAEILTYLIDLLLGTALGEQIIFRGESQLLIAPAAAGLLALLVLRALGFAVGKRLSLPSLLAYITLAFFSLKADLAALDYMELHGEFLPSLSAEHLAGLLILLECGWLCVSGRVGLGIGRIVGAIAALSALALWILSAAAAFQRPAPLFGLEVEQHYLALLIYLGIGCRLLLCARDYNQPPGMLNRLELTCVTAAGLFVLCTAAYCLSLRDHTRCRAPQSELKVSRQFLLYLLTAEDPRFMRHAGVDFHRLRQAVREALENGASGRGGSTITMQLAKVCYLGDQRTLLRKWNQILMAFLLDFSKTKDVVILQYLENIPFAPGLVGMNAAAKALYSKPPQELDAPESLRLVLSIFDPTRYNATIQAADSRTTNRHAVILALSRKWARALNRDIDRLMPLVQDDGAQ